MSERFYVNWPLAPGLVTLDGPEAHHLAVVCRLRPGDAVCLFNGDGHEYPARVVAVQKRGVELVVQERLSPQRELGFRLEVAAPLPRGDRAQFLVEKLTELGVATFVPLSTRRSVVHPREAKLEKLQRYVIEANKQCRRNVLMELRPLVEWANYCRNAVLPPQRWLGHPGGDAAVGALRVSGDVALAVGPEGGFAEDEIQMAIAAGWRLVDLGPRILRVETAAVVLAAQAALARAPGGEFA